MTTCLLNAADWLASGEIDRAHPELTNAAGHDRSPRSRHAVGPVDCSAADLRTHVPHDPLSDSAERGLRRQPSPCDVDRVVRLGNGDYNVHYIGVNWPHHVFLNQDLKVIGAE
jgi:hypothetical protein